ncbi:MAG: phage tail protein [Actinomycetota bacterium]|nr:phage tail protein [Actinomycetota bacterium]HSH23638.1 phage tail protein [Acidimicrobiales bacterium]
MRGAIPGLPSPTPLAGLLPGIFQEEDRFALRFTDGLDEVLAPVFATLDSLEAYVDPLLSPADFLDWLGGWVGVILDENWPVERRRLLIANAVDLYRTRGTAEGLRAELELLTGGAVDIRESGVSLWSPTPGGEASDHEPPWVAVRVVVTGEPAVSRRAVDAVVAAAKPAHVAHTVEVVGP